MKTIITHSAEDTKKFAAKLIASPQGNNVLALYGDLGSGKTTFSQGIGKALGITRRMISPTFVVIRNYTLQVKSSTLQFANLYHIDLYRVQNPKEVLDLGILDFMKDPTNLVLIEWAEKMGEYVPNKRVDVRFEYMDENSRKISVSRE